MHSDTDPRRFEISEASDSNITLTLALTLNLRVVEYTRFGGLFRALLLKPLPDPYPDLFDVHSTKLRSRSLQG